MREHKYKVWHKARKKFFTLCLWGFGGNATLVREINPHKRFEQLQSYWVDNKDLEFIQHTGRKDENGKEIYEDTLLKDPQGNIGRVFYNKETASFLVNWHRKDGTWDTDSCIEYGEVIGTFYENPELLEGKNNG